MLLLGVQGYRAGLGHISHPLPVNVYDGNDRWVKMCMYEGNDRWVKMCMYEGTDRWVKMCMYEGTDRWVKMCMYEGNYRWVKMCIYEVLWMDELKHSTRYHYLAICFAI